MGDADWFLPGSKEPAEKDSTKKLPNAPDAAVSRHNAGQATKSCYWLYKAGLPHSQRTIAVLWCANVTSY